MNRITERAVLATLADLVSVIERAGAGSYLCENATDFHGRPFERPVVGNGQGCPSCLVRGFGTPKMHEPDCELVKTLRDARELIIELRKF